DVGTDPLAGAKDHHAGLSSVRCPLDEQQRTVAHINIVDVRHYGQKIFWPENMHGSKLRRQLQRSSFFAFWDVRHSARSRSLGRGSDPVSGLVKPRRDGARFCYRDTKTLCSINFSFATRLAIVCRKQVSCPGYVAHELSGFI